MEQDSTRIEIIATFPVRAMAVMPNGCIILRNLLILASWPVSSMTRLLVCMSTTLARKISQICMISGRTGVSALTRSRTSSRSTYSPSRKSSILITSTSFCNCLMTCSSTASSPRTTMVMCAMDGSTVGPVFSVSMLKPRPLNMPAMRASTPKRFSTRTESVWRM